MKPPSLKFKRLVWLVAGIMFLVQAQTATDGILCLAEIGVGIAALALREYTTK